MEPAKSIVTALGGPTKVAAALKMTPSGVTRWYAEGPTGCGGLVPSHRIPALCKLARKQKRFLEPNMFFDGHI